MSIKPVILQEEIGKIPLFQGVAQSDLEQLVQAAHRKQYQAGEFFFLQDNPAERMYVLLEGQVKLSQVERRAECIKQTCTRACWQRQSPCQAWIMI